MKDDAIASVTFGKTLIERTMDCRADGSGSFLAPRSRHGSISRPCQVRFGFFNSFSVKSGRFVGRK